VALALGDVAGKGLGPALIMASLHALVRSRIYSRATNLPGLVKQINAYLLAATPPDLFVTLFLGMLDLTTGSLTYVNAGHPAPLLLSPAARPVALPGGGTMLGIFDEASWETGDVMIPPESLLVLFSDGVTEARNRHGQLFHTRRLIEGTQACPSCASAVLKRLLACVNAFVEDAEQADDVSLLVVHRA
jgi:sigma-B regulation protein RsbU (phosphoserine phosphatase)